MEMNEILKEIANLLDNVNELHHKGMRLWDDLDDNIDWWRIGRDKCEIYENIEKIRNRLDLIYEAVETVDNLNENQLRKGV